MNSDVLVIKVELDVVAVCRTDPQREHRLVVIGSPWVVLRAGYNETLLIVLLHNGQDFVTPQRLLVCSLKMSRSSATRIQAEQIPRSPSMARNLTSL